MARKSRAGQPTSLPPLGSQKLGEGGCIPGCLFFKQSKGTGNYLSADQEQLRLTGGVTVCECEIGVIFPTDPKMLGTSGRHCFYQPCVVLLWQNKCEP